VNLYDTKCDYGIRGFDGEMIHMKDPYVTKSLLKAKKMKLRELRRRLKDIQCEIIYVENLSADDIEHKDEYL